MKVNVKIGGKVVEMNLADAQTIIAQGLGELVEAEAGDAPAADAAAGDAAGAPAGDAAGVAADAAADAALDNRPSKADQLIAQFGTQSKAELALLASVLTRSEEAMDKLPETIKTEMMDLMRKERLTKPIAAEERAGRPIEMAYLPNDPIGFEGKLTAGQAGLFLLSMCNMSRGQAMPAEAAADEVVCQALKESVDSAGGVLVPDDETMEIIKGMAELIIVWPKCDIRTTKSKTVTRPVRNTPGAVNKGTAAAAELAEVTETALTYDDQTWAIFDADAYYKASFQLLDDSPVNIMREVNMAASEVFADNRDWEILYGRGDTYKECKGILPNTDIRHTAVTGAFTVAQFLTLFQTIPQRYRRRASSLMPTKTFFAFAADLATTYRHIEILGLPDFAEDDRIAEGNCLIGDLKRYRVYRNHGVKLVTQTIARQKQVDMVFSERFGGHVTHTDAFVVGTGITY